MSGPGREHPASEAGDYLWDGTGAPDPSVEQLERALAPAVEAPATRARRVRWGAMAAAVLVAVSAWMMLPMRSGPVTPATMGGWTLASKSGGVNWQPGDEGVRLSTGAGARAEAVRTDGASVTFQTGSRAVLAPAEVHCDVLIESGEVFITTPATARPLAVRTTHLAMEIDPRTSMMIDATGSAIVKEGELAATSGNRRMRLTGGMTCVVGSAGEAHTPLRYSAVPEFATAVRVIDEYAAKGRAVPVGKAVNALLDTAQWPDALTIWNVLPLLPEGERWKAAQWIARAAGEEKSLDAKAVRGLDDAVMEALWRMAKRAAEKR